MRNKNGVKIFKYVTNIERKHIFNNKNSKNKNKKKKKGRKKERAILIFFHEQENR